MLAVALTGVALSSRAPVPVTGGNAAERSIVRQALRALDPGVVTWASVDGNRDLVLGPPAARDPGVRYGRAQWEAQALVATVAARFGAAGFRLRGYRIMGNCGHNTSCGSGGSLAAEGGPAIGPPGVQRLRGVVLAHARAAGFAVRTARVLPIGGGVLSVVVRLREDQLLDPRLPAALATLFGPVATKPVALHFVSIEAPDGTAIAYGGTFVNGGSWNYGGDTGTAPVRRSFPAALAKARTDLVVRVTGGVSGTRTFRFVCGPGAPGRGNCRRLLADRWALLVPTTTSRCAGSPAGALYVSISGMFAGHRVRREYDGCYGATGRRWMRFAGA
jgi:hypothetical protein